MEIQLTSLPNDTTLILPNGKLYDKSVDAKRPRPIQAVNKRRSKKLKRGKGVRRDTDAGAGFFELCGRLKDVDIEVCVSLEGAEDRGAGYAAARDGDAEFLGLGHLERAVWSIWCRALECQTYLRWKKWWRPFAAQPRTTSESDRDNSQKVLTYVFRRHCNRGTD